MFILSMPNVTANVRQAVEVTQGVMLYMYLAIIETQAALKSFCECF